MVGKPTLSGETEITESFKIIAHSWDLTTEASRKVIIMEPALFENAFYDLNLLVNWEVSSLMFP